MKIGRRLRSRAAAAAAAFVMRTRGAADDDVGFGQRCIQMLQVDGRPRDRSGQYFGPAPGTVGYDYSFDAGSAEMSGRERDHLAGADHQGRVCAQVSVHTACETHRCRCERNGIGAYLSF